MATFKPVVFSSGKHLKQDRTTNIKIRIYHNSSTQYYISPNQLLKSGSISEDALYSEKLNFELTDIIQGYRGICINLGVKRMASMSCIEVRDQIVAAMEPDYEFIDFVSFAQTIIEKTEKQKTYDWWIFR